MIDGRLVTSVIKNEASRWPGRWQSPREEHGARGRERCFRVPTFIVGDDHFFGNDRLGFLEERLGR
jgi:2-hydroxychromene-2-carboxylate isomerase